jgi:hypothetical protein
VRLAATLHLARLDGMQPVTVLVFAPRPGPEAGPLERLLADARDAVTERHRAGFLAAGATSFVVQGGPHDSTPFGRRLGSALEDLEVRGLVVLGSGAIPLAGERDLRSLVEAAADEHPGALANHRYSADAVAIARADVALRDLPPDLPTDNALPRWLSEAAGIPVRDLARRRRLAMDVDSPIDLLLLERVVAGLLPRLPDDVRGSAAARVDAIHALGSDPSAELLVAGRTSVRDLRWLERRTAGRTRALVEERGLKTATSGALVGRPNRRAPRSVLGLLLDRDGPEQLGRHAAELGDGAIIDTRVLLAHRLGPDDRRWPSPEDRYASDLLLAERVEDPWLAALTAAARDATIPILLGGHALVGPGVRLVLGTGRRRPDHDGPTATGTEAAGVAATGSAATAGGSAVRATSGTEAAGEARGAR